jgi:aminomethyltransferase
VRREAVTVTKKTVLSGAHVELGARMVDFAGFDMPVQYAGVTDEHHAVRNSCGLFDVSHMGEFFVEGPGAETLLNRATPNDVGRLKPGRAHYTSFLSDEGTFVDDLLIYRLGAEKFMVVVNASNIEKDWNWLVAAHDRYASELPGDVEMSNQSEDIALLALQGPRAPEVLATCFEASGDDSTHPSDLKYYGLRVRGRVAGRETVVISRTGYTGEDGFEIYMPASGAPEVWKSLIAHEAVSPAGLGARDTLRLECGMALYGNDIDDTTTPIEAGLRWTVKLKSSEFTGREVLARQVAEGVDKQLVGLEITGRGIARHGHELKVGGETVGRVTSGTRCPTLEKAVALGYLPPQLAEAGTEIVADVRGRAVEARVVELPFYSRKKS